MKRSEIKTAVTALESNDMLERSEVLSLDGGGFALSVQLKPDGVQRVYYSLEQVINALPDGHLAPITESW